MRDAIRRQIILVIKKKFGVESTPEFTLEVPENPEHGDYATNAAMALAKILGKNPNEVVGMLAVNLTNSDWQVKAAGPGFLNFYLSDEALFRELAKILKEKNKYGRGKAQNDKIQLEFVSANPTGPLTLANGRGGFLGDALANVLEFSGYKVEREYYINDTGNQIITFGKSLAASLGLIPAEENFYKGEYIKAWSQKNSDKVKKFKDNPLKLGQFAAKDFLKSIKKTLAQKAGIEFDRWTSEERHIHKKSFVKKTGEVFSAKNLSYKKDGAVWLKTTQFGDDKDRVLITSDGYPTYFAADAGHYLETKNRGFSRKINILGPDHYGYVRRIQAVAKIIGLKSSDVIVTQAVRLMKGGAEVKMSKRGGTFVAFEDLIDEGGRDAARYFFLERSADTHIDFNMDLAREENKNNPVYYIQYAHARMKSIFRKSGPENKTAADLRLLAEPEEKKLIKTLIRFPETAEDISRDHQVNRLCRYALDLARAFHDFYEKRRVISDNKKLSASRLALIRAAQIVLKNSLNLLGIDAPDKM